MSLMMSETEFNEKYLTYQKELYKIAYNYVRNSYDAEDIVQNVFMKYLKAGKTFNTNEDEKYWLIRVTINESINYLKKASKRYEESNDELINTSKDNSQTTQSEHDAKLEELAEIVNNLPNKYKEVIVLFYYDKQSIKDISIILKLSEANVKKRLERARNYLKERWNPYD